MDDVAPLQRMEMWRIPVHCQHCDEERLLDVWTLPEGRTGVNCQVCGRVSLLDQRNVPIHAE